MIRLYNVRKKCTRTLDLTTKWRLTSCNGFLVTVHATLSVALMKCIKYTRNIGKVDYFQFFGCLSYTLETRSRLRMFFVKYLIATDGHLLLQSRKFIENVY